MTLYNPAAPHGHRRRHVHVHSSCAAAGRWRVTVLRSLQRVLLFLQKHREFPVSELLAVVVVALAASCPRLLVWAPVMPAGQVSQSAHHL